MLGAQAFVANSESLDGPSWLTFIAPSKDSLWSVTLSAPVVDP